ncbi:hypothetical protein [Wenjunlia tyrosinilytica]|uniref:Uncharacterized protein n=1 Tax=Wenjunlia tyrosinilytica TaxID=1544741 RepID=A0A918E2N1_9ACTN|nr:hypothetical protein [Wenjunlia tyrosinilytica]GGP00751.1 hypothetical protein GCM10012280_70190 [Wenjunlia tyrosinilytica]
MKTITGCTAAAAVATAALASVLMGAHPAGAAQQTCSPAPNTRSIDLPGRKPTTLVGADVCARLDGDELRSDITLHWQIEEDQVEDNSTRFDSFKIISRLERRSAPSGSDSVVTVTPCDFTTDLNKEYANSVGVTCSTSEEKFNPAYWWSSDATVVYDIKGDGKGPITWELTGSGLVH